MSLAELAQALNSIKQPLPAMDMTLPTAQTARAIADPYGDAKKTSEAYGLLGDHMRKYDSEFAMPDGQEGPSVREGEQNTPMNRLQEQIQQMRTSGNPFLIKEAQGLTKDYQARMTAPPAAGSMSPSAKIAIDLGLKPGTKSFQDFVRNHAMKSGTQINMGGNQYTSVDEASKLKYLDDGRDVLPFTDKKDLTGKVESKTAAELKDATAALKSVAMVDEMSGMLFGDDGIYSDVEDSLQGRVGAALTAKVQNLVQTDPRYRNYINYAEGTLAPLAKSLGQAGSLSDTDLKLVKGLIPNIHEGIPDSPAVAKEKVEKINRLIRAGLDSGSGITPAIMDEVLGKDRSGANITGATKSSAPSKDKPENDLKTKPAEPKPGDIWREGNLRVMLGEDGVIYESKIGE